MANIEARHGNGSLAAEAKAAGLIYVGDERAGLTRRERNGRFAYLDAHGKTVRDGNVLARIKAIAIPPAWQEVWISPSPHGHIQATGRDARGRKQYCYHADFRAERDSTKFAHIFDFARALPKLRRAIDRDMRAPGLPRRKVIATIVHLLDTTLIRIGNADYARTNGSFGLTTLRNRHVSVEGGALRFEFKGKSGKAWRVKVSDARVARIVKSCQDLPGQHLFQYVDEAGERHSVDSTDVNEFLRETTGRDVTAKDFRTWAGTVLAATALQELEALDSEVGRKASVRAAIDRVAARLGNTPAVCRKCYVHPAIVDAFLDGALALEINGRVESQPKSRLTRLTPQEAAVLAFLRDRLGRRRPKRGGRPVGAAAPDGLRAETRPRRPALQPAADA